MNEKNFSKAMFVSNLLMNLFVRNFWLIIASGVLLVAGIFDNLCLYIGFAFLALDLICSFISAIRFRRIVMSGGDGKTERICDAVAKDTSWRKNVMTPVEGEITEEGEIPELEDWDPQIVVVEEGEVFDGAEVDGDDPELSAIGEEEDAKKGENE